MSLFDEPEAVAEADVDRILAKASDTSGPTDTPLGQRSLNGGPKASKSDATQTTSQANPSAPSGTTPTPATSARKIRRDEPPPLGTPLTEREIARGQCFRSTRDGIIRLGICAGCHDSGTRDEFPLYFHDGTGKCKQCVGKPNRTRDLQTAILSKIDEEGAYAASLANACRMTMAEINGHLAALKNKGLVVEREKMWFKVSSPKGD